jgi:hypothetical protein
MILATASLGHVERRGMIERVALRTDIMFGSLRTYQQPCTGADSGILAAWAEPCQIVATHLGFPSD